MNSGTVQPASRLQPPSRLRMCAPAALSLLLSIPCYATLATPTPVAAPVSVSATAALATSTPIDISIPLKKGDNVDVDGVFMSTYRAQIVLEYAADGAAARAGAFAVPTWQKWTMVVLSNLPTFYLIYKDIRKK